MKHILLLAFTCILQLTLLSQSIERDFKYNNAIKLSPFNLGQSEFQASYEYYFAKRKSSIIVSPSVFLRETQESSMVGYQAMLQYRVYLTHVNKDEGHTFLGMYNYGFYAGLYGLYFDYLEDYTRGYWSDATQEYIIDDFEKSAQSVEGGAILGLQVDITSRILLDFYVGGGIRKSDSTDTYIDRVADESYSTMGVFDPAYTGVKPTVGFQIGILF